MLRSLVVFVVINFKNVFEIKLLDGGFVKDKMILKILFVRRSFYFFVYVLFIKFYI